MPVKKKALSSEAVSGTGLAVAQTCPVPGDVESNMEEHLRLARAAADGGAGLVLFPELSLTGYELEHAPDVAFTLNDRRLEPLIDAASDLDITMIVGAPVRMDSSLHIGALVVDPCGGVGLYTKQRLGAFSPDLAPHGSVPPPEPTVFDAGVLDPLVKASGRRAALAICADIGDAGHPRRAADRGADTYLASMLVVPSDYHGDATRLAGYAGRYDMVVALANFGGATGGLPAAGRSAIWSTAGELLVQLGPSGAAVGIVTETTSGWLTSMAR